MISDPIAAEPTPTRRGRAGGGVGHFTGLFLLGGLALTLPAQSQQVAGLVAEHGSLAPAPDAVVTLYRVTGDDGEISAVGTTVTDEDGYFIFIPTHPGAYRVQAEYDGLLSPLSPAYEVGPEAGTEDLVLMVPSPLLMLATSCNVDSSPGAVVVGVVRDAESDVPIPYAHVAARWIAGPGFQDIDTRADARGRFLFCGIPPAGTIRFRGESFGRIGEWGEVELSRPALVFHDVTMGLGNPVSNTDTRVLAELVLGRTAGSLADLRGQLLDRDSDAPIPHAVVRIRGTGFQAVTDGQGRFTFTDLQPSLYTLEIRHLGYSVQSSEVELGEGEDVSLRLRLSPQAVELEGLEVVARTREEETIRASSFQRYVVSGDRMADEEARGATLPDLLRRHVVGLRIRERYTQSGTRLCLETNRRIFRLTRFEQADLNAIEREMGQERRGMDEAQDCDMVQVILDGVRVSDAPGAPVEQFLQAMSVTDIESVEFLPPSQGATMYGIGGNVANGVLVIHSRGKGPYRSMDRDRRD